MPLLKNDANKRVVTFVVLAFVLSAPFYYLVSKNGGLESPTGALYVMPLMWMPGLAGLITTFIYQRNFRGMGWGLGKPKYYLIAYLLPILYAGIAYGVVWLSGLGGLDFSQKGVGGLLSSLTIGVVTAAITAMGEEIGWRGLLVPQLARINTFARTALISGIIWGLWHVPLIISGDYSSGAPAWFAITGFIVLVIGMSFAFAWIRLASGSIWPAVLMHSVHNSFIQSFLDKVTVDTGSTKYFTTEFGAALAVMGIIVAVIFWRIGVPGRKQDATAQPETGAALQ
jgi:membrane protease YdiL (CAAX protease family)